MNLQGNTAKQAGGQWFGRGERGLGCEFWLIKFDEISHKTLIIEVGLVKEEKANLSLRAGRAECLLALRVILLNGGTDRVLLAAQCYFERNFLEFGAVLGLGVIFGREGWHLLMEEGAVPLKAFDDDFGSGSFDMQHFRSFGYGDSLVQNQCYKFDSLLSEGKSTSTEILEYLFLCLLFYILSLCFNYKASHRPAQVPFLCYLLAPTIKKPYSEPPSSRTPTSNLGINHFDCTNALPLLSNLLKALLFCHLSALKPNLYRKINTSEVEN